MKASNFYHLVKGLIRNRDINNKCKIDIYEVYFKKIFYMGPKVGFAQKKKKARSRLWK
jgi:hypothetical protein